MTTAVIATVVSGTRSLGSVDARQQDDQLELVSVPLPKRVAARETLQTDIKVTGLPPDAIPACFCSTRIAPPPDGTPLAVPLLIHSVLSCKKGNETLFSIFTHNIGGDVVDASIDVLLVLN